ncbi:MAG: ABC transporter substrate-binding protein, partial [Thermoanaerobaculia bacterium]
MRRFIAVLFVVGALCPMWSCRRSEVASGSQPGLVANPVPEPGGTVYRRLEGDVHSLNPLLTTSAYEKDVLSYLFLGLVDIDQNLRVIPGLAESWDISSDGKLYTFHLDPDATFSDGTPVTAEDVVWTVEKIVDPTTLSSELASSFDDLDPAETKAIDARTAQIGFKDVRAGQILSFDIPILPKHVYEKGNFQQDYNDRVIGNGPYRLVRREPGKQILLTRRTDYAGDKPYIQNVVFRVIADQTVAWNAMKKGDIDETRITSDQWLLEKDDPRVQRTVDIHRFYQLGYNFIPWNERDPILSDARVRRALTMCLDRAAIVNNLYHGTARIITGPFTPDQWAYDPGVEPYRYDPEGAKSLLAQAGWSDHDGDGVLDRDGKKFELELLLTNQASKDQAQIFQQGLQEAGIE